MQNAQTLKEVEQKKQKTKFYLKINILFLFQIHV